MDLALNNLQMLICHKTQTTNQPTIIEKQTMKTTRTKEHSKQSDTNKNKFIYLIHKKETLQNITNILI